MKTLSAVLVLCALAILTVREVHAQAENVPAYHPVYIFLKRMEIKGILQQYDDVILPLSRRQVAEHLKTVQAHSQSLSSTESGWLKDFMSEFQFELTGSAEGFHPLIGSEQSSFWGAMGQEFTDREKFIAVTTDSSVTMFLNGLLTLEGRGFKGDPLGPSDAEYIQIGGRIRGTLFNHLGYYLQATNAQFWGSRELLQRDPMISQSHALSTGDAQNFDFAQGYVRYDAGMLSAQLGRERVLWGYGVDQKMIINDYIREFDFIRADFKYKAFRYTFIHGWLLGTQSSLVLPYPADSSSTFVEPVIADKYFAAHRFGLSFPELFDVGFQEMYIYSNRSVDLGYLNPLMLLESLQRSRGERDNGLWAFDFKSRFFNGFQIMGTLFYDDIHVPYMFSDKWFDKYAWQLGFAYTDALTIRNTTLFVEYLRVEPYVFGHERSRDNNYTSLGVLIGPQIGPNADLWTFRLDYLPFRNLFLSARVSLERKGMNPVDSLGTVIRNVGGDFNLPHRETDPDTKKFLDGTLVKGTRVGFKVTWEFLNQMWLDGAVEYQSTKNTVSGALEKNTTYLVRLRTEL
jgi:hypothetical protein